MEAFVDHYAILNVLHEAEQGEIARAYRAKIKKVHPDRNRGLEGAEELTRLVITARDVLLDPVRRQSYDVEWRAQTHEGRDHGARRRTPPSTYAQAERDAAQQRADARARREREAERRAAETDAREAREAEARASEARAQAERASKVREAEARAAEARAAEARAAEARAAEARAAEARAAEARAAEARAQTKRSEARRARYAHVRRPPGPSSAAEVIGAVVLAGLFGLGIAAIADALSDRPPS